MGTRTIVCLFLSVALLLTGGAHAAEMDEIVVTATKRDANIRDVPLSINAQTAEDIERSGAQSLEDMFRNVAGLAIQNLGPGKSQFAIRGVSAGQIIRDQPGVKEQVGIYLDESVISLSLFTPNLDLYDLNRVETLRGPQGTLFGSGSVGGTIRYITNQADTSDFDGHLALSGNQVDDGANGASVKGMVNVTLGDEAAMDSCTSQVPTSTLVIASRNPVTRKRALEASLSECRSQVQMVQK